MVENRRQAAKALPTDVISLLARASFRISNATLKAPSRAHNGEKNSGIVGRSLAGQKCSVTASVQHAPSLNRTDAWRMQMLDSARMAFIDFDRGCRILAFIAS